MNYFVAAIVCAITLTVVRAGLTDAQKKKLTEYDNACRAETGVSDEAVNNARQGNFALDDDKLKAHAVCINKKAGIQDDDGKLQKDVLKKKMMEAIGDEDKVNKLIEKCAIQKATPGETALESFKCFQENKPHKAGTA